DFDTVMDRNEENIKAFLGFLCSFCDREGMHHLDREAVEALLEFSARTAGDQEKLSTHFGLLVDIIREANFWAEEENASTIGRRHIEKTLEERVYRSNLVEERIREMIARGTILIDTEGVAVGQVNGLSVLTLGDYQFGRPGRITASVGPGRDGVVDIEREVELGGPIHSKGVLILGGYLAWKYGRDKPLTMSARVVFEQSYSFIDGDSASSAELYALLSALSGKPLRQGIAVTGSVNQHGQVQAIGGVNEKIEGFYAVCKIKGLTGDQGVIIPRSNVRHLMLKDEVIEAVEAGKFHIWAVDTIDQGMEILTGLPAGEADAEGHFPEGSINYLVDKRLRELNECLSRRDEKQDEEE
ncbi:MAG: ATP-dependent protease, partial [Calditrichaeota bacterium]